VLLWRRYVSSEENGQTAGFVKANRNLAEFIVLNAGHMIPSDQPLSALFMLDHILDRSKTGHQEYHLQ